MRTFLMIAALALSACAGLAAEPAPPPQPAAAGAAIADTPVDLESGRYALDPRHVSVVWRVRHLGLSMYTARFDRTTADLDLNAEAPTQSKLSVSIDANSVSTGLRDKDGELTFDRDIAKTIGADKTPTITFVSTAITRTGEKTGTIVGDLTMNGVTKPFTLDAAFTAGRTYPLTGKPALAFSATGKLKRSDWGVTNWLAFTSDEVEIIVEAEFLKS